LSTQDRQRESTRTEAERGVLFGFAAYGMWGVLPLYFHAIAPASPPDRLVGGRLRHGVGRAS
jgi:EamA domain-containing membrane protein RarD